MQEDNAQEQEPTLWHRVGYGKCFLLFTAVLWGGVGGGAFLLRMETDNLESVPLDLANTLLMGGAWGVALLLFVFLVVTAKAQTGLQNLGALAVIFSVVGMGVLVWGTQWIFTERPVNALYNRVAQFTQASSQAKSRLPEKISEGIIFADIFYARSQLVYAYQVDRFDSSSIKAREPFMRQSACKQLSYYFAHGLIGSVMYRFQMRDGAVVGITVKAQDCGEEGGR